MPSVPVSLNVGRALPTVRGFAGDWPKLAESVTPNKNARVRIVHRNAARRVGALFSRPALVWLVLKTKVKVSLREAFKFEKGRICQKASTFAHNRVRKRW